MSRTTAGSRAAGTAGLNSGRWARYLDDGERSSLATPQRTCRPAAGDLSWRVLSRCSRECFVGSTLSLEQGSEQVMVHGFGCCAATESDGPTRISQAASSMAWLYAIYHHHMGETAEKNSQ